MADLRNDIDKYLKGELTPSEMHALEKRALSDPFLEDALEGAAQLSNDAFEEDLRSLDKALDSRIHKRDAKVVSFWVWPARIAAGLTLIAVATWLIINLQAGRRTEDLALKEDKKTTQPAEQQDADAEEKAGPSSKEDVKERLMEQSKQNAPAPDGEQREERLSTESIQQAEPLATEAKPETPVSKSLPPGAVDTQAGDIDQATNQPPALSRETTSEQATSTDKKEEARSQFKIEEERKVTQTESSRNKAKRAVPSPVSGYLKPDENEAADSIASPSMETTITDSRIIKGQITAEDGTGLPGVNVMIKGTNIGAVADESGNYQIRLPHSNADLVFSYIGYSSREVDAKDKNEVNVQLQEDASQLSEIVVVGYGTERPVDEDFPNIVEFAAPDGGRKAFKQYLEKNLRYPEQALANNIEGKVTVQFNVETNGQLSGFKVIRGIGNGCDEEVIRLIKQGPKWTATKRNTDSVKDRVKVRMRFALPKKRR